MRSLLACSVLCLTLISNAFGETPKEESKKESAPIVLEDVMCGDSKALNDKLTNQQMVPILVMESERYTTVVWEDPKSKGSIIARYLDDKTACILGMGVNFTIAGKGKQAI